MLRKHFAVVPEVLQQMLSEIFGISVTKGLKNKPSTPLTSTSSPAV